MKRWAGVLVAAVLAMGCGATTQQVESEPATVGEAPPQQPAEAEQERFTYCCEEDCNLAAEPEMLINADYRAAGKAAQQQCLAEGAGGDVAVECEGIGYMTCMDMCTGAADPCP